MKISTISRFFFYRILYMLWFKFILGLMFFGLVSILFTIVLDYGKKKKLMNTGQKKIKIEPV